MLGEINFPFPCPIPVDLALKLTHAFPSVGSAAWLAWYKCMKEALGKSLFSFIKLVEKWRGCLYFENVPAGLLTYEPVWYNHRVWVLS